MTTTPATPKAKKPSSPRVAKKAAPTPPPMFSFKAGTGAVAKVTAGGPVPTKGCDVAVVAVYKEGELTAAAKRADVDTEGLVANACKTDKNLGNAGSCRVVFNTAKAGAPVYVLVGLDEADKLNTKTLRKATSAACEALKGLKPAKVFFAVNQEVPKKSSDKEIAALCARTITESFYSFSACKKQDEDAAAPPAFELACTKSTQEAVEKGAAIGQAIGNGMQLTKDLGNLPGNICTPNYLAETAKALAKQYKLGVDVLDHKKMEALGMFSLLSVGKASSEPPKLIVLKYNGAKDPKEAPVVLVGKGITFDTGGISLKPGAGMDEMKYDMCGAASVLGTMKAAAEMKLALNLIVVVPTAENMPAGNASKPGDVVVSMSGQTIEILNTDAEGRLILCDALTYVERFNPAAVVDVATLTGACIVALGHVNSGLFSPDDDLANELFKAGQNALDTAWRMPLDEEYHEQLKSNFADMANIGGPPAGSVTAACFLQKYTKAYSWAHLDIAGTAWHSGKAKGASGRPVPLLAEFVMKRAKS
ncbi:MAG: leucyl aminopeptidase [Limnobacter sp.]|jgi:leucyl aminopeptidase|uniref:leucyl aminopeptidase n=1 Tax=Limnobacter sp. TaxID=2003368 RepID=UPI0027369660|nr:leucyl aminopeptidase [Limnobacter sp.]MDP3270648.1 leucyl aminopeptidase [Limnobacter sp.]